MPVITFNEKIRFFEVTITNTNDKPAYCNFDHAGAPALYAIHQAV